MDVQNINYKKKIYIIRAIHLETNPDLDQTNGSNAINSLRSLLATGHCFRKREESGASDAGG